MSKYRIGRFDPTNSPTARPKEDVSTYSSKATSSTLVPAGSPTDPFPNDSFEIVRTRKTPNAPRSPNDSIGLIDNKPGLEQREVPVTQDADGTRHVDPIDGRPPLSRVENKRQKFDAMGRAWEVGKAGYHGTLVAQASGVENGATGWVIRLGLDDPNDPGKPSGQTLEIAFPSRTDGGEVDHRLGQHLQALHDQWANPGKNEDNSRSEVLGEISATLAELKANPNLRLELGFESDSSTGGDQIWSRVGANGEKIYAMVEAKGGSAQRAKNRFDFNGRYEQMSDDWILDRLVREKSPATQAILNDLDPMYGGYGRAEQTNEGWRLGRTAKRYVVTGGIPPDRRFEARSYEENLTSQTSPARLTMDRVALQQDPSNLVQVPDPTLGSLHSMMLETSPTYRSLVNTVSGDGPITIELTNTTNDQYSRSAVWDSAERKIVINQKLFNGDRWVKGDMGKLAARLATEMANAARDTAFAEIARNAGDAESYATAMLEQEYESLGDVETIGWELTTARATGSDRLIHDVDRNFGLLEEEEWNGLQRQVRGSGSNQKKSIHQLYREDFGKLNSDRTDFIVRRPHNLDSPVPAAKVKTEAEMTSIAREASFYFAQAEGLVAQKDWQSAASFRRSAEKLLSRHNTGLKAFEWNPSLVVDGDFYDYFEANRELRTRAADLYRSHIIPEVESRTQHAHIAADQVESLLVQAQDKLAAGDVVGAADLFELAARTQAKQEALLKTADELAAEYASAVRSGLFDPLPLGPDWAEPETDLDNTGYNRPQLIHDAVERARNTRTEVNAGLLGLIDDEVRAATDALRDLDSLSQPVQLTRLAEAVEMAHDADRSRDMLRSFGTSDDPRYSMEFDKLDEALKELYETMNDHGVDYGDKVAEEVNASAQTAAENNPSFADLLGEDGMVHTAFRYGGQMAMVVGTIQDGLRIVTSDDKFETAAEVAGAWAGAAEGAMAAEAAVAPYASWFGPYGWMVDGFAGLAGGALGYWGGSHIAGSLYNEIRAYHDPEDPLVAANAVIVRAEPLLKPFDFDSFPDVSDLVDDDNDTVPPPSGPTP